MNTHKIGAISQKGEVVSPVTSGCELQLNRITLSGSCAIIIAQETQ